MRFSSYYTVFFILKYYSCLMHLHKYYNINRIFVSLSESVQVVRERFPRFTVSGRKEMNRIILLPTLTQTSLY